MKFKKLFFKNTFFFFKRWENKGYSIFNSLGKIIVMLTLPLIYLSVFPDSAMSQDTLNLQKLVVQSNKKPVLFNENFRLVKIITKSEIDLSTSDNLTDLLKSSLGVDVRQRGVDEVQADISINGGTFDQVLVLLNGVPMSDAQTGHHSFSLPVDLDNIYSIEILQGPGTRLYGLNAYSGAINIITKPEKNNSVDIKLSAGQFGYKKGSFTGNFIIGKLNNQFSISSTSSSGFASNTDFSINKIFYNSTLLKQNFSMFFQAGIVSKKFGAYNFYTPSFPYQYESIKNEMASVKIVVGKEVKHSFSVYYRRNQDRFELFRESYDWYVHAGDFFVLNANDTAKYVQDLYIPSVYYSGHNYHVTNVLGVNYNANFSSLLGETVIGFDIRNTSILSNVLGSEINRISVPFENHEWYTKNAYQNNYSFFIDHSVALSMFRLSAGMSLNYNSMFDFYSAFGSELAYKFSNNASLFFSVNQGVRLPTFTDLYYQGPSNIGNKDLKPEKSTSFELGQKFVAKNAIFQSAVFYRHGKNTIDWVKISDEYKWQPMNYTSLETFGFNLSSKIYLARILENNLLKFIDISYSYLYQQKLEDVYISKYVLDYPSNTFNLKLTFEPIKNLNFSVNGMFKQRKGTYTFPDESGNLQEIPYNSYFLVNSKMSYKYKKIKVYISCSNLFNSQYHDISNVKLPGRWMKAGMSFEIL